MGVNRYNICVEGGCTVGMFPMVVRGSLVTLKGLV